MDSLWSETLKEKNINTGSNYAQLVSCEGVTIENIGDKQSFETQIKEGSSQSKQRLEIEDKENHRTTYKRQRMEHLDNANVFNTDDNEYELEKQAEQTVQYNGKMWVVNKINVRDALTKWQKQMGRSRTDLAYYDIIDITPGTNSEFIRSLPNDAKRVIMRFGSTEQQSVTENVKELIVKFIKADDFRKIADESYNETRQNDTLKFVWDFVNLLADSFERESDLADFDLSELAYREIFLAPAIRSLFRGMHREMHIFFGEKHLFASSEELNLKKTDRETRGVGNKVDIIWSLKSTDIEFSVGEVSGPPNKRDHSHFFGDKLKIAKMLKIIIKHGGAGVKLGSLKLYGLQIYNNEAIA
ncbi:10765_t:CDS:2 [Dentiscutata erythropus]|uniref:10765_t:CDS:1 n=1 Tax=Dentiscutata erythropus TaxID=1348616 RepID=A0A9N9AMD1_9GLOM|nr:10765_t:CDS:2 [Dentiscutata erythropus]